tara:strand:- start:22 stop:1617 length:1596 start_codon:yes stop_codon:yes gene_type:complete
MQGMQPQPEVVNPKAMPRMATPEAATSWVETNLGRKATQEDIDALKYQGVMGNTGQNQRLSAELAVVDLYKNVLDRPIDDKAREEYTKMYMKDPTRVISAINRSAEATQAADQRFFSDAKRIAEEKGITLPENFVELSKLNNPFRDVRSGYADLNRTKFEEIVPGQHNYGMQRRADVKSGTWVGLPLYVTGSGKATFDTEEEAAAAVKKYGPDAVVDLYAKDPASFYKNAAANAYADIWLLKTTHPDEIADQLPAQVKEMSDLEAKYRGITEQATALGVTPEDISAHTGEVMKTVGGEYEKWYEDTHSDGFMNFLLLAGAVMLGGYGLSQLLGTAAGSAAGAAGTAGASSAAAAVPYSWAGSGATLMAPGVGATTVGVGLPMFSGLTAAEAAAAMKAGTAGTTGGGNFITSTWDKIKNIPTKFSSGAPDGSSATEFLPGKVPTGKTQGLMDIIGVPENIQTGLDVAQKGSSLLNQLTGNTGQPPTGGLQRQRVKRDVSTLIPNSVTMVDPNKWAEMTTLSRPGGLNMTRGV